MYTTTQLSLTTLCFGALLICVFLSQLCQFVPLFFMTHDTFHKLKYLTILTGISSSESHIDLTLIPQYQDT